MKLKVLSITKDCMDGTPIYKLKVGRTEYLVQWDPMLNESYNRPQYYRYFGGWTFNDISKKREFHYCKPPERHTEPVKNFLRLVGIKP